MRSEHQPHLCDPCLGLDPDGRQGLPEHDRCQPDGWCECWTEVLIQAEETAMTAPEQPQPEQTDNTERPEDGEQDVSQDGDLDYSVDPL